MYRIFLLSSEKAIELAKNVFNKEFKGDEKKKDEIFNRLLSIDFTSDKKYLNYIVRQYLDSGIEVEQEVLEDFDFISTRPGRYDLGEHKSIYHKDFAGKEGYDFLKKFLAKFETDEQYWENAKKEVIVIYDDGNIKVNIPITHRASVLYGVTKHWCTSYLSPKNWNNYVTHSLNKGLMAMVYVSFLNEEDRFKKIAVDLYTEEVTEQGLPYVMANLEDRIHKMKTTGVYDQFGNYIKIPEDSPLCAEECVVKIGNFYHTVEIYDYFNTNILAVSEFPELLSRNFYPGDDIDFYRMMLDNIMTDFELAGRKCREYEGEEVY